MNNIVWFLVIAGLVALFFTVKIQLRGRRKRRATELSSLVGMNIMAFRDNSHNDPVGTFRQYERTARMYSFADTELPISVQALRGLAVMCQRHQVETCQLAVEREMSEPGNLFTSKAPLKERVEDWEKKANLVISRYDTYLDAVEDLNKLNNEWIRANGFDPQMIQRIDPPVVTVVS